MVTSREDMDEAPAPEQRNPGARGRDVPTARANCLTSLGVFQLLDAAHDIAVVRFMP